MSTNANVKAPEKRVAPALQQTRRAVEADALTQAEGSKPSSPTTFDAAAARREDGLNEARDIQAEQKRTRGDED